MNAIAAASLPVPVHGLANLSSSALAPRRIAA